MKTFYNVVNATICCAKEARVLSHFVIIVALVIPVALCNKKAVALCNNRPSHFVIKKAVALCNNTCRTL